MPFTFHPFDELPEVIKVVPRVFGDDRGWFMETYKESDFASHLPTGTRFVQDNHSLSLQKHVIRGIHFQNEPLPQGKLVRVSRGTIFDVAVDLRAGSPTYKRFVTAELSGENKEMLWIPPGFGHGFCALTEEVEAVYKATGEFSMELDRSVAWNDPAIGIPWPTSDPILSDKDRDAPLLADSDNNMKYLGSEAAP